MDAARSNSSTRPHIVVVGAGAFGGWTALHLLRRGARVTLLDAWGPGNSRASSGGETRIIRATYGPKPPYVELVARSLQLWQEAEQRWQRRLFIRTGVLWMAGEDRSTERASVPLLRAAGLEVEELSAATLASRYPHVAFDGVSMALFEPHAGYLTARLACEAVLEGFLAEGGTYRQTQVRVPAWTADAAATDAAATDARAADSADAAAPDAAAATTQRARPERADRQTAGAPTREAAPAWGERAAHPASRAGGDVAVDVPQTRGGELQAVALSDGSMLAADRFVFACGPWMSEVLGQSLSVRITPTRQEVFYFGTPAGEDRFDEERFPTWIDHTANLSFYGMPGNRWRGFKLANDTRGPRFDPTNGDRLPTPGALAASRAYLARRFPALRDAPLLESRVCQYEESPDGNYIVDRHPSAANVWVIGGGSGHGFKAGPAIGELAAGLVLDDRQADPLFRFARFAPSARSDGDTSSDQPT